MAKTANKIKGRSTGADREKAAETLRKVIATGKPCPPLRRYVAATDITAAYGIQDINTGLWLAEGRRLTGRKIGITSTAVQKQLGVDQPDYGMLFADMAVNDNEEVALGRVIQPRVEGEIAFHIDRDLDGDAMTVADIIEAIDYVLPAIEIVGSRIADWKITIGDTIADNASAGLYVLGTEPRALGEFDIRLCGMVLELRGEPVSVGAGAACLGSPVVAMLWLANKMVEVGRPLQAGDIVMSGALGPMVGVQPGDVFELQISGLGSVRAAFAAG